MCFAGWLVVVVSTLAFDPQRAGKATRLELKSQEPWMQSFAFVTVMVGPVGLEPTTNRL